MQVTAYIADWNEAMHRQQAGTLQDFAQAVDDGETWIQDLGFRGDSHSQYCAVADAYEELREALPGDLLSQADRFMSRLITFDGYCTDLGDDGAIFALSISPESAADFAALSQQIDFAGFESAFHAACSDETRAALAEDSPESAFEVEFLPYIEMWVLALRRAAAEMKGLLVHWG